MFRIGVHQAHANSSIRMGLIGQFTIVAVERQPASVTVFAGHESDEVGEAVGEIDQDRWLDQVVRGDRGDRGLPDPQIEEALVAPVEVISPGRERHLRRYVLCMLADRRSPPQSEASRGASSFPKGAAGSLEVRLVKWAAGIALASVAPLVAADGVLPSLLLG